MIAMPRLLAERFETVGAERAIDLDTCRPITDMT